MTHLLTTLNGVVTGCAIREPLTQPVKPAMYHPAMNTKSKILPTIHLNGSSAQSLTDDYSHARRAVQEAITALKAVDFNARDYYVHSNPAAWMLAVLQREEIYQHLSDAFNALHEHELHCSQFIKEIRP